MKNLEHIGVEPFGALIEFVAASFALWIFPLMTERPFVGIPK